MVAASPPPTGSPGKIAWSGRVVSVQPRIRLLRSFDQRHHDYRGYVLTLEGTCAEDEGRFAVAIGEAAQAKHRFETFCYGPKSCSLYKAGPKRTVPGRNGMSYTEEDRVDEEVTGHRGLDE
jgi:hypothetical protein